MAKRVRPPWAIGIEAKSSDFRAEEVLFLILGPPIGEISTMAAVNKSRGKSSRFVQSRWLDHIRIGAKYDMAAQELFQLGTAPFAAMKQSDAIRRRGQSVAGRGEPER